MLPVRRALLSVSDKSGLPALAAALAHHGAALISTGGTAAALRAEGHTVIDVSAVTGFPEILDGRVKTLAPQLYGGILARRDAPAHLAQLEAHGIAPIDLVVVNLYPFEATVVAGADPETCIENIDVGGPALIRAAAKNAASVAVLTSTDQYADFIAALAGGGTTLEQRRRLAGAAFRATAAYDAAIGAWHAAQASEQFPERFILAGTRRDRLRYGENPHQQAAFYAAGTRPGIATAHQHQGKALSYNNLNDTDAAIELAAEFAEPAAVIVKHANPCGVATAPTVLAAFERALAADPVSAFGGVVALNRPLDEATAEAIAAIFAEVIAAPAATDAALAALARKKALRLLTVGAMPDPRQPGLAVRSLAGGFLVQSRDTGHADAADLRVVTRRAPTAAEIADLLFAFRVCKHVKSNAIVLAHDGATVGIGAGQMSRVDSASLAAARHHGPAVVASDAFFPFPDGLQAAVANGATAVIQPGGSVRDAAVIAAADAGGIAMVFTGLRHFRH